MSAKTAGKCKEVLSLMQSRAHEKSRAFSSMRFWMSSREKGMEESSSSRKLWLAAVLLSTISCFIRPNTWPRQILAQPYGPSAMYRVQGHCEHLPGTIRHNSLACGWWYGYRATCPQLIGSWLKSGVHQGVGQVAAFTCSLSADAPCHLAGKVK